jgi:Zn-dependent protease with chaperone function
MLNAQHFTIKRHSTEMPLFILAVLISLPIIVAICISVVGLVYAAIFLVILFFGHTAAIAFIRGSGIKVTPDHFPDLYQVVEKSCQRIGIKKIPEVYIVQGNGLLNAMATKFAFTKFLVIYSSLLDACEDNEGARVMIIGHELGHMKAGHLRWDWLIWPGLFIPFLGNALSRGREYTSDRYGAACAGKIEEALAGLVILAGGKKIAKSVSIEAYTAQIKTINTGFMRIGEWMMTHPTLVRRICALEPSLNQDSKGRSTWSFIKGVSIILITMITFAAIVIGPTLYLLKHRPTHSSSELNDTTSGASHTRYDFVNTKFH